MPLLRTKLTQPLLRPRAARTFTTSRPQRAKNEIYASVRRPEDLHTYQLLPRAPLLTLWTTSWCATCRSVAPLLESLVSAGVGEREGGVAFCAVDFDAPDIMALGLGLTYAVTSVPTLLSFGAGGVLGRRVVDGRLLADRAFLEEWIREEARLGAGTGGGTGGFGGLFRGWR
ncbi:hypothetical protein F4861DRAFT_509134 [Xylaria intraflava]|nr:hypothetical protein F4861DRAFT_509134 [Xylaria intraflava]